VAPKPTGRHKVRNSSLTFFGTEVELLKMKQKYEEQVIMNQTLEQKAALAIEQAEKEGKAMS